MTTILLVEDAYDLAQLIIRELEASGYKVLHATDGLTALRLHEREHPVPPGLDWMLPMLDGLEVLRRLRQKAPTPVLMLTARGEEADRVIGLELGLMIISPSLSICASLWRGFGHCYADLNLCSCSGR